MTDDNQPNTAREAGTELTPNERMEVTKLYLRLHRLYPERNYLRSAIQGFPPNAGRGELEMLRGEVEYEEHCEAERVLRENR